MKGLLLLSALSRNLLWGRGTFREWMNLNCLRTASCEEEEVWGGGGGGGWEFRKVLPSNNKWCGHPKSHLDPVE